MNDRLSCSSLDMICSIPLYKYDHVSSDPARWLGIEYEGEAEAVGAFELEGMVEIAVLRPQP